MSIVSITTLKTYFETGDFPTQQEFIDLIDTLANNGTLVGSAAGLTATGTNQATALVITSAKNRIDTVAAGTGVKPNQTAAVGFSQTVQNEGANDLAYFPFLGDNILGQAVNTSVTISAGNQLTVFCYTAGELTLI